MNTSESNLIAWLSKNLSMQDHFLAEEEAKQELEASSLADSGRTCVPDRLLQQFEEIDDDDVLQSAMHDQDATGAWASPAWLEEEKLEDLDDRLNALAEERAMYKAQIQVRKPDCLPAVHSPTRLVPNHEWVVSSPSPWFPPMSSPW